MKETEIIQRMRQQAADLVRMADALEAELNARLTSVSVTPDAIKSVIRIKGMRPQHLAQHFNVPASVITNMVRPENGLKLNHRGWVISTQEAAA